MGERYRCTGSVGLRHRRPARLAPWRRVLLADLVATSAAVARDPVAHGQGRGAGRAAARGSSRTRSSRRRVPHRRAPPGPHRRRLAHGVRRRRRPAPPSRRSRCSRSTRRSTELAVTSGAGSVAARQALLGRPVRPGHRAGGRLRPRAAHRGAAPGRARRRDDRCRRQGGRRAARARAPRRDARRATSAAPPRSRSATGARGARGRAPRGAQPDPADAGGERRATSPRRSALTGPASVEWKLDGARVQVHRARRRGPHLHPQPQRRHRPPPGHRRRRARRCPPRPFVLDGEILGGRRGRHARGLPGHDERVRSRRRRGGGDALLVRFFDVLHVDGVDLIDEPLATRHEHLDALVGDLAVPRVAHRRPGRGARRPRRGPGPGPRGRDGQGPRLAPTTPGGAAGRGARSSRSARSTSSCSPPSGATGAGRAGCRTCTSAPAIPTAAS